jgi:hypothetical protein
MKVFGLKQFKEPGDVMAEIVSLLPTEEGKPRLRFKYTHGRNCNRMFDYGCDMVVKRFEEQFNALISK